MDSAKLDDLGNAKRAAAARLTIVARQMRARFDETVAELGVTRSQWGAIAVISQNPGATQRIIAERLEISEVSAGRLVERLVADGMVERRKHDTDKRAHAIFITSKGEELTEALDSAARRFEALAWEGFDEAMVERLGADLKRLHANLSRTGEL